VKIAFIKQKQVAFGGGEGYVCRLMKGCAERGHDVYLITASWTEDGFDFPVTVHTVSINRWSRRTKLFSFSKSVQQCVESEGFDCVFSLERTESQQIWRAGEGVHKVWLEHRAEFEPSWKTWFNAHNSGHRAYFEMEERCVRSTPHIIANSSMVKGYLERVYPELESEISVIHNGCDLSEFSVGERENDRKEVCRTHTLDETRPIIIFPGSGWVRKGLDPALRVLCELSDATLLVIGRDKPEKWRKRAAYLGVVDRVIFIPPTNDIVRYYRAADVALLPTWSDPFSNISLEALACGTPLVTTEYNGGCEVVKPGENGFVAKNPADIESMVLGVKNLFTMRNDPHRAKRISESVSNCSLERNLIETLKVIEKATQR